MLSDDAYGDRDPVPYFGRQLHVPDLAVGRLVETPAEIADQVEAFERRSGLLVRENDDAGSVTTGYDFLNDGAAAVNAYINAYVPNQLLEDEVGPAWTGGQRRSSGRRHRGAGDLAQRARRLLRAAARERGAGPARGTGARRCGHVRWANRLLDGLPRRSQPPRRSRAGSIAGGLGERHHRRGGKRSSGCLRGQHGIRIRRHGPARLRRGPQPALRGGSRRQRAHDRRSADSGQAGVHLQPGDRRGIRREDACRVRPLRPAHVAARAHWRGHGHAAGRAGGARCDPGRHGDRSADRAVRPTHHGGSGSRAAHDAERHLLGRPLRPRVRGRRTRVRWRPGDAFQADPAARGSAGRHPECPRCPHHRAHLGPRRSDPRRSGLLASGRGRLRG